MYGGTINTKFATHHFLIKQGISFLIEAINSGYYPR